jgi:hypothetical protein
MGRDFSINHVESTYKPVSFCMYKALNLVGFFKSENDSSDAIPVQKLASVILSIDNITTDNNLSDKGYETFRFYDNETKEDVKNNLIEANKHFKDALIYAIAQEEKYVSVSYL